jgi:putative (di)nucleoside polyphosphate hydrolase
VTPVAQYLDTLSPRSRETQIYSLRRALRALDLDDFDVLGFDWGRMLPEHVELLHSTPGWLRYRLPSRCVRQGEKPRCIGQKQVWFLLRLVACESNVRLDANEKPEFDRFRWVDYWYPLEHVVHFKRDVYTRALCHVAPAARVLAGTEAVPEPTFPAPLGESRSRRQA